MREEVIMEEREGRGEREKKTRIQTRGRGRQHNKRKPQSPLKSSLTPLLFIPKKQNCPELKFTH